MKQIAQYIRKYFYEFDKKHFVLTTLFTAGLIFLNYFFELDKMINQQDSFLVSFFSRWLIFLIAFVLPYFFYRLVKKKNYFYDLLFMLLIITAPAIFSLKSALQIGLPISDNVNWNDYW